MNITIKISPTINNPHNILSHTNSSTYSIRKQLHQLAHQKNLQWDTHREQLVIQALQGKNIHFISSHLKKICKQLNPAQLHHVLKTTAEALPTQEFSKDNHPQILNNLKKLLTLEQIEAAIHSDHPSFESSLKTAKEMAATAQYYLDLTHPASVRPTLNLALHNIIWAIESAIDTVLSIFGYELFRRDMENVMETNLRLEVVLTIVSVIAACVSLAFAITGNMILASAIVGGSIVLLSAGLTLYFKYLKPAPRSIRGCINLTAEAAAGKIEPLHGRQHYIDQIASILIANRERPKVHPLLIGRSGVGKTEIIRGLAQAIAQGRYPQLNGIQVQYSNTADLTNTAQASSVFDTPPSLDKILDRTRHRPEKTLLALDEIHEAVKAKNGNTAERLKTMLDGKLNVLGCTTIKEYIKYLLKGNEGDDAEIDNPFARRFKPILIEEMNKDQTQGILNKWVLKHPELQVTPEAIESIYDLTRQFFPNRPQPYMSCRILGQAISNVKEGKSALINREIAAEDSRLEKNISSLLIRPGLGMLTDEQFRQQIEEENHVIAQTLEGLKEKLEQEKLQIKNFKALTEKLKSTKELLCRLAIQLNAKPPTSSQQTPLLKEFALTSYYLNTAWENAVQSHLKQNGSDFMQIDKVTIQHVINEELLLQNSKKQMLKKTTDKNEDVTSPTDSKNDEIEIPKIYGQNTLLKIMRHKRNPHKLGF